MISRNFIQNYLSMVADACDNINHDDVVNIYNILVKTNGLKGKIYICGNGGSSSTAAHFQNDLNNAFSCSYKTMPAYCLTDNNATLTAIANDKSYDDIFSLQLECLLKKNDILIAISCSGNSTNVIKAAEFAKTKGNKVISLVGFDGGKLKQIADTSFHININNMQVCEDLHLVFCHLISKMVREKYTQYHDFS